MTPGKRLSDAVTICAVGDIMLGDSPQVFGYGVGSQIRRNGPMYPFESVRDLLTAADLTVGNLEVAISAFDADSTLFDSQIYRAQPSVVDGLAESGFDVLSVCTNHMMQHGQRSFEETVTHVRSRGISVIGAHWPEMDLDNAAIVEAKGRRIGLLGYNFRPQQYFLAAPTWPEPSFDLIQKDIDHLRAQVDLVLVSIHWGDEFIGCPAPWQVDLAHRLVDAGADVILGHHPHILQGIERYKGAIVAYSLGNFVFDYWQPHLRRSAILRLTITDNLTIDYEVEPIMIDAVHRPTPLVGEDRTEALRHIEHLSTLVGTLSSEEYERTLQSNFRSYRRGVYKHYILNAWRYPPRHFLANLLGAIRKRMG